VAWKILDKELQVLFLECPEAFLKIYKRPELFASFNSSLVLFSFLKLSMEPILVEVATQH